MHVCLRGEQLGEVGLEQVDNSFCGALQREAAHEQNDEHHVRKDGREVGHLSIEHDG